MPRDAVSRTAHVGTVGTNGLTLMQLFMAHILPTGLRISRKCFLYSVTGLFTHGQFAYGLKIRLGFFQKRISWVNCPWAKIPVNPVHTHVCILYEE